jgi:hypothetical protein
VTRAVRFVAAIAVFVAAAAVAGADPPVARAAGDSTAVIVIDAGAGVRSAVIHFDGSISGIRALELAGANPVTYGFSGQGAAVCALDGVGNPADQSCLIGPNGQYWAYFLAHGGATSWTYSRGCACASVVGDGDVEGWRYGTGAAPRAAAAFCTYVDCPPPPTSPGDGDGGGSGSVPAPAPGDTTTGPTGGPTGATPQSDGAPSTDAAADGPAPDGQTSADGTTTTEPPTTTTRARDRDDVQVAGARAARRVGAGGDGAGSPAGVVNAAGALAVTAGIAVWLRRRRHAFR